MRPRTTTLTRSTWGNLIVNSTTTTMEDSALLASARALLARAARQGLIDPEADHTVWSKRGRIGPATHHDIYDIQTKPMAVLVCIRQTEGTKYGVKTTEKQYVIIARCRSGLTIEPANKAIAARVAKACGTNLGLAIQVLRGEAFLPDPERHQEEGFKLVRRQEDGSLVSVWDGSPWVIGETRIERALRGHQGGLYYYRDLSAAITAARTNTAFRSDMDHKRLAILRVRAEGPVIEYGYGKFAASRLTPLEEIGSTL